MATPYFQLREESVASTQDVARQALEDLPVLAIAPAQTEGRGRGGAAWITADRALAVSFAFRADRGETRPISLIAGVAAARTGAGIGLKWPNDLMASEGKVGGILVERSGEVVVVGLGLNLWWREPPQGMAGLLAEDPGPERHRELGALWGAELAALLDHRGWPREEYIGLCSTLGEDITWEPEESGKAVDVDPDGALVVESGAERRKIRSGAVSHVRPKS
ncbi:MAG: biotin--[acetyl-CoA-carboxylase] ligase [Actinobacteria bacterium]|nr:biotin--[acetyl-CoA-carboxylase] ligase [Actinomycetota bacterium]